MTSKEAPRPGTLFGVGVGPGDPELITLKAHRVLHQAPVLCVPKSREEGDSYVRGFVSHLLDPERQQLIEVVFPMTKDRSVLERHWNVAMERVLSPLHDGLDVAFVTEGDPLIYSTFMHLYELIRMQHPEIPVEVIPGVSSVNASAAAAGLPLVDGAERLAVLPATYEGEELAQIIARFDTVVLLKVHRVFDRVLDVLEQLDLSGRAVYVKRCGTPDQEIVRDVSSLRGRDLDYLSLLIVKKRRG